MTTADISTAPHERTSFPALADDQLLVMLHHGRPAVLRDIAAAWGRLSVSVSGAAENIAVEYGKLSPTWTGRAASQYADTVTTLVAATRRVSDMAARVRDVVHDCADALDLAQRMFPPPAPTSTTGTASPGARVDATG